MYELNSCLFIIINFEINVVKVSMENMVALIDSGIKKDSYVKNENIIYDTKFKNSIETDSFHGTLCATTMQGVASDVKIYSLELLDNNEQTNSLKLCEVLEYLINSNIKIINLSLTTVNDRFKNDLKKICDSLYNEGKIIISSADNSKGQGYPACFRNVIGVKGLNTVLQNEYWYNSNYIIQCACDSSPLLIPIGNDFIAFGGTSKATSIMSSIVFKMIKKNGNINKDELEIILKNKSKKTEWEDKRLYLNSKSLPSFLYQRLDYNSENLQKIIYSLSETVGYKITIQDIIKDYNLLRYGIDCNIAIKLLKILEKVFCFKIIKPIQYYRLINIGSLLALVEELENE